MSFATIAAAVANLGPRLVLLAMAIYIVLNGNLIFEYGPRSMWRPQESMYNDRQRLEGGPEAPSQGAEVPTSSSRAGLPDADRRVIQGLR